LVDLRPTIGSFSFVTTKTYAVYLVFRAILAFLAAAILSQSHLVSNPFLLSLASVVTSVTVLQNFALNVAGKEAANLSDLFDTFKDMMETEEKKRVAEEKNAKLAAMADELSALNLDYLKWEARVLSQISASGTDPVTEAEQLKGTDQQQVYLANYLVTQNPEFSRRVIEEAVRYKATQTKTAP
jgi:ABC-type Zn uptake system ZnuABC Zn-binding protein ZnuA